MRIVFRLEIVIREQSKLIYPESNSGEETSVRVAFLGTSRNPLFIQIDLIIPVKWVRTLELVWKRRSLAVTVESLHKASKSTLQNRTSWFFHILQYFCFHEPNRSRCPFRSPWGDHTSMCSSVNRQMFSTIHRRSTRTRTTKTQKHVSCRHTIVFVWGDSSRLELPTTSVPFQIVLWTCSEWRFHILLFFSDWEVQYLSLRPSQATKPELDRLLWS